MADEEEVIGEGIEEEVVEDQEGAEEMEEVLEEMEGEEGEGEGDASAEAATAGGTAGGEINVNSFDELRLDEAVVLNAQEAWRTFINSAASREAAGEAIYAALFDAAPSLQSLFTTPRAIQAMKFMNGLNQFVTGLSDPPALKVAVETLGFGHLALDVTIPRVVIFRDAILDLFQVELGNKLTKEAYNGWRALLNYVGGAIIYIKAFYADRIRLLGESWALCSGKDQQKNEAEEAEAAAETVAEEAGEGHKKKGKGKDGAEEEHEAGKGKDAQSIMQNVPTTFKEMFQFNAAVMGFGTSLWMNEVLACFDNIVSNVSNSGRLVEECDVLVCRIAKVSTGKVNLAEYKSCMLASLRSLLPKDWTTAHEVAWSWLWENVERLVQKNMGLPPVWEKAYAKLLDSIDEATGFQLRKDIYLKFFALAPAGQDYFKQSNTYLHLVATKVLVMVIDMYRDPVRMVDDISALGLRHVGYAIPTEYMPPFASACVEVVQGLTKDQTCVDGFQWSIGLIAKSLVRTILEGSTIVMKAINYNTKRSIQKALGVAPRGERANWMLIIQVGTQRISPLAWSIESGSLESAGAMINDLLVIRADRDKYYYGADDLFARHWDIIKMCTDQAPALLPELFTGLIWRSRSTFNGLRRVNYYIKHMLIAPDGKFAKALEWVAKLQDPSIVCHPTVIVLSDLVWTRIASRSFLFRKSWFLFNILVFLVSQSIIENLSDKQNETERIIIACCRGFIYLICLGNMLLQHASRTIKAYRKQDTFKPFFGIPLPKYLDNWQMVADLFLACFLLAMACSEPILHCLEEMGDDLFTQDCKGDKIDHFFHYSLFSALGMVLFYVLLIDMAVFNNKVSAFVLVVGRMMSEVGLFLTALAGVILTFSSALSCLHQKNKDFQGIPQGALALFEMVMKMYSFEDYQLLEEEPIVLVGMFLFLVTAVIFLLNMLIAQLNCSYDTIYQDMVGYARLKRIRIVVETMPLVPEKRWVRFLQTLALEERLEFNEGDIGLAGGIQVLEPASANPTTIDMIKRFGGSTSPSIQWPEEDTGDDDSDKFERIEKLIQRAMQRLNTKGGGGGKKGGKGSSSAGMSGSGGGDGDSGMIEGEGSGEGGGGEGDEAEEE